MASLIGQTVGVVLAALLLMALLRRLALALGFGRAAAVAGLVLLGALGAGAFRESWHALDVQRRTFSHVSSEGGRSRCMITTGIDVHAIELVGREVPSRERYYFQPGYPLGHQGLCIRFLLLPRLQVATPEQTHYLVFWGAPPRAQLEELRRRGAVISRFGFDYAVARVP